MSSDNSIADVAEGATKGILNWSKEQVSSFIQKLKDKKLAFIQDTKTIEIVKEQYASGEVKFYQKYIEDKELLFLVKMGLTLRKLENEKERQQNLRSKLFKKYKSEGLHIAELVQNGILNRYSGILIENLISIDELKKDIFEILKNIEKHAIFIQGTSNKAEIIKKADMIINSHSPSIFIVSGIKQAAKITQECIEPLKIILKEYELERFATEEKETLFFKKKMT